MEAKLVRNTLNFKCIRRFQKNLHRSEGFKKISSRSEYTYSHILKVWKLFLGDFWLTLIGLFRSFSGEFQKVSGLKSHFYFLMELFPVLHPSDEHKESKILVKYPVLTHVSPDGAWILSTDSYCAEQCSILFYTHWLWCQHDIINVKIKITEKERNIVKKLKKEGSAFRYLGIMIWKVTMAETKKWG